MAVSLPAREHQSAHYDQHEQRPRGVTLLMYDVHVR